MVLWNSYEWNGFREMLNANLKVANTPECRLLDGVNHESGLGELQQHKNYRTFG